MRSITVQLLKPGKNTTISYEAELLREPPGERLVRARWDLPALAVGFVRFETGDLFYEYHYSDRWYNVFAIHRPDGSLKCWYCNVTRPAHFDDDTVISEDLELDLLVAPDRTRLLRLDVDEFEARDFASSDPATYAAALAALDQLETLARAGTPPFDRTSLSGTL